MKIDEHYRQMCEDAMERRYGCGNTIYAMIIIVVVFLCSCATKTKVEYVDRVVTEYKTQIKHDTLVNDVHDSIYHTIFQKGDTIYDTKYKEIIRYKARMEVRVDTLWRDSIQANVVEKTTIKREIPNWCYYTTIGCALFFIMLFVKIKKWLHI